MMLDCNVHGYALGVLVSPDVRAAMLIGDLPESDRYIFTLDDEEVMWFLLSRQFVRAFPVTESARMPLPESYPTWVHSLEMACIQCLHSLDGRLPLE